jgi:hypothetical protein
MGGIEKMKTRNLSLNEIEEIADLLPEIRAAQRKIIGRDPLLRPALRRDGAFTIGDISPMVFRMRSSEGSILLYFCGIDS